MVSQLQIVVKTLFTSVMDLRLWRRGLTGRAAAEAAQTADK